MYNIQKNGRDFNTIPDSMDSVLCMNYLVAHFLGESAVQNTFHEDYTFNYISASKIIKKYNNKVKSSREAHLGHISYKSSQGIPSQEAVNLLINYFLGEDWYVVDSVSVHQMNSIAFTEIKRMYKGQMKYLDWIKFNKHF